ncbi:MAG: zf-HC2 domain-containing protein [Capsulimonadales bacterium]|nr:zf-HC2 domain-containing protein [Capsulimonadales bacterium]
MLTIMGGGKQGEHLEYNQCQEAVRKLNEYLSHELRPDEEEEVQRHLAQCKGCFSKFHFEETLLKTIRARVEQVQAPNSLREKILGLLSRPEPAGRSGEWEGHS